MSYTISKLPFQVSWYNERFQVDTEMCSGSKAGSYLRLIDFVYHSTPGLRVIKKKRRSTFRRIENGHVFFFFLMSLDTGPKKVLEP